MMPLEKSSLLPWKSEGLTLLDVPGNFPPEAKAKDGFIEPLVARPKIPSPAGIRMPWQVWREWRRRRRSARKFLQGFTHISQYAPEDIFVVGYPKSGNTWFQDLVAGVVYGVNPAHAPPSLAHALVPDV